MYNNGMQLLIHAKFIYSKVISQLLYFISNSLTMDATLLAFC